MEDGQSKTELPRADLERISVIKPIALPTEDFANIEPRLSGLWLIKGILPAQGLALLYGHPGCGKSFLALDMALHVALGRDWQGRRVKPGFVIYIGAEGSAGLRNRIAAFRRHHSVNEACFSLVPTSIDMQAPDADVKRLAKTIQEEAVRSALSPGLIVIDTLSKTFGSGKENTDDMAAYVANCGSIAAEFNCCVMPIHHRPKDAESEEPRGHGSLKGGMDTVVLVEAGKTRSFRVIKQKDGEEVGRILFTLEPVFLGLDEDGDPVTSCVVIEGLSERPVVHPLIEAEAKLAASDKSLLKVLDDLTSTEGSRLSAAASIDPAGRLGQEGVRTSAWRDSFLAAGTNRENQKRVFNRSLKKLCKVGIVLISGEFAWRNKAPLAWPGQSGTTSPRTDRDKGTGGT